MCPSSAAEIWSKAAAHTDPRTGRNRAYSTVNYTTFRYFQKHDEWWAIDTQKGKIFKDEPGRSQRLEWSDVCGGDVTVGRGVFTLERLRVWPWNKRRKWFGQGKVETIDWGKKTFLQANTLDCFGRRIKLAGQTAVVLGCSQKSIYKSIYKI